MNKKNIFFRFFAILVLITLIFPQGVSAEGEPPQPGSELPAEGASPYQQALQKFLTERAAAGDPVPASVVYEYDVAEPVQTPMLRSFSAEPEEEPGLIVTATTTILYENPQQAGYDAWPTLDVEGTEEGANFDEEYYQKVQEAVPDYWETYEFGQEPRKETIVETFEINYSAQEVQPLTDETTITTPEDSILMGFTFAGPNIDLLFERELKACLQLERPWWWPSWLSWPEDECTIEIPIGSFKAGLWLDFSFGLRLPAEVHVSGPDRMVLGSPYELSAVLTPSDWTEEQYKKAGVASKEGNEYVLSAGYFVGVEIKVLDHDICGILATPIGLGTCHSSVSIEESTSFETPFGAGSSFPIPSQDIKIKEWSLSDLFKKDDSNGGDSGNNDGDGDDKDDEEYSDDFLDKLLSLEVGIGLQPNITSSKITANWQGKEKTDCNGSGQIEFTEPNTPVTFGPVTACDLSAEDKADIRLSDFRYYFNEFSIDISAYIKLTAIETIELGPLYMKFFSVDLSQWAEAAGLYLGKHYQCAWFDKDNPFKCGPEGPDNKLDYSFPTVDLTAPKTTALLSGLVGNHDWYRSDVEVTLSALDNLPGCEDAGADIQYNIDGALWSAYTGPFIVSEEGSGMLNYRALDDAGNLEETRSIPINVDKTPPLLSATRIPPPNGYGWNNTDVTVHFTASDAVSGLDLTPADPTFTQEGGGQSVMAMATDMAGNMTTITVDNINIDKTDPALVVTGLQTGTYANTSTITAAWIASDALSGIASETGSLDTVTVENGQPINLLLVGAGPHNFVVEAVDKADNAEQVTVPISVTTDIDGLIAAKEYMCELGWINKPGVCNSLNAKLNAAKSAIERGREATAMNQIQAFLNELSAQNGKAVTTRAYDVLKANAFYVITHLDQ